MRVLIEMSQVMVVGGSVVVADISVVVASDWQNWGNSMHTKEQYGARGLDPQAKRAVFSSRSVNI